MTGMSLVILARTAAASASRAEPPQRHVLPVSGRDLHVGVLRVLHAQPVGIGGFRSRPPGSARGRGGSRCSSSACWSGCSCIRLTVRFHLVGAILHQRCSLGEIRDRIVELADRDVAVAAMPIAAADRRDASSIAASSRSRSPHGSVRGTRSAVRARSPHPRSPDPCRRPPARRRDSLLQRGAAFRAEWPARRGLAKQRRRLRCVAPPACLHRARASVGCECIMYTSIPRRPIQ